MKEMEEKKILGTGSELEKELLSEEQQTKIGQAQENAKPEEEIKESDNDPDWETFISELLKGDTEDRLNELKVWLFKENIRILAAQNELKEQLEKFEAEKNTFYAEMRSMSRSMDNDRKRLVQESRFFDQKMQILQSGFAQLDADRRKFQKEKDKFDAKRDFYDDSQIYFARMEITEMLFKGVNSILALKKRYKDLIKMFHPDNVAGDHEMVQIINREYEELKKAYDLGKQA